MAEFDIATSADRNLRHCRTRAFCAHLFEKYPLHPSNSFVWADVARCWDELVALKLRMAQTDGRRARLAAHLDDPLWLPTETSPKIARLDRCPHQWLRANVRFWRKTPTFVLCLQSTLMGRTKRTLTPPTA